MAPRVACPLGRLAIATPVGDRAGLRPAQCHVGATPGRWDRRCDWRVYVDSLTFLSPPPSSFVLLPVAMP